MFDVDHFKSVNDRFGHPAGDMVLKEIAGRVSAELRVEDCIGRLGGEEFAVLLPDTSAEKALNFAERLRTSLAA
jgi:two-component system cell cycle response regulator